MKKNVNALLVILGLMAGVFIINNLLLGSALNRYGILPRHLDGLWGILFSPFLHGSWSPLTNNLIAMTIFSLIVMTKGLSYYWRASTFIIIVGGLGVWAFARENFHIGASGWIFGLWALIIANAWYSRSFRDLLIAAIVILLWGGMVFGVLPGDKRISFEAHLFGAIAGILYAASLGRRKR